MIININSIKQKTSKIWLFFLDLIFPIECLGCGREGFWLCGDCFKEVRLKPQQYCLHCKKENDFGQFCPPPARLNASPTKSSARTNVHSDGFGRVPDYLQLERRLYRRAL